MVHRRLAGVGLIVVVLAGCGLRPTDAPSEAPSLPGASGSATRSAKGTTAPGPGGGEQCEYVPSGEAARPVEPPRSTDVATSGTVTFTLKMTEGDVAITMDRAKAPCTVNSFESLAEQKYFDGTRCHRLVDMTAFLLQCGDPTSTGSGGPGYTFADETDGTETYTQGVVAMANSGANTNGSQFFLVYCDSTSLDPRWKGNYTIFGRMNEKSLGVVGRMAVEGQDGANPAGGGKPNNPSEIITVTKRS